MRPFRPFDRASDGPPPRALNVLVAWGLLNATLGLYLFEDGLSVTAIWLLVAAALLTALALLGRGSRASRWQLEWVALGLLGSEMLVLAIIPYRPFVPAPPGAIQAAAVVGLVGVAGSVAVRRLEVGLVVAALAALAARAVVISIDAQPTFDVPFIQAAAGHAILSGENPYLTHIYVEGFPYWPFSAIAAAGGLLAGDARWANVVADLVTAMSLLFIGDSIGMRRLGAVLGVLWLWSFAGLFMTWEGFPEPILIALSAASVVALTRGRPRFAVAGLLVGLAIATKQFGLGLVAFMPFSGRDLRRTTLPVAVVTAAVCIVPFVLWDPNAFVNGSVVGLLHASGREFALNLLEPLPGLVTRWHPPFIVAALAGLAAGALTRRAWPGSTTGWLASSAMLLLVVFLFNEIAFVNYYQIVLGLLACLVVASDVDAPGPIEASTEAGR